MIACLAQRTPLGRAESCANLCHGPVGLKLNVLTSIQRFPNIDRVGRANRIVSLRKLHAFHAVARLGSVTQAAAELHLSQSAVSIQIGELEASIGAPLVTRTGRGVLCSAKTRSHKEFEMGLLVMQPAAQRFDVRRRGTLTRRREF